MKRTPFKRCSKQLKRTPLAKVPKTKKKRAMSLLGGKKAPSKSQAKLKKELDRVFSIYIRQKYPPQCYTCGKKDTPLQCGHFISRQYLATRWDENNCRPQCVGCNIYGNGKALDFEEKLKKELGNDYVEALKAHRHEIIKLDRVWYKHEIEKYKALLK